MLSIGQNMNGFTVTTIAAQFVAGKPEGAVIIAHRGDQAPAYVVAHVDQEAIDDPAPAQHWNNGAYLYTGLGPDTYADVLATFAERSQLSLVASSEVDVRGCSCGMADWGAPGHDGSAGAHV